MATPRLLAPRASAAFLALAGTATLGLAACGGSGSAATGGSSPSSSAAASGSGADAGITVSSGSVSGMGTVLVNGAGRTLYILTSEKGGKITCTDDNGCTKVWPDTELPAGTQTALAGSGIDLSKLSTVKGSDGSLYITYAGWPLYTFSGDSGPGQANGEGIVSFGGTWEALTPAGTAVVPSAAGAAAQSTTSSTSTQGGYGY